MGWVGDMKAVQAGTELWERNARSWSRTCRVSSQERCCGKKDGGQGEREWAMGWVGDMKAVQAETELWERNARSWSRTCRVSSQERCCGKEDGG
jgi:hypothetical protein